MLIELLSMSNYVQFNVKLAQLFDLKTAIYLSQIMDINQKAIRKEKITENYFTIDRQYIQSRTTITPEEQEAIDANLKSVGVLKSAPRKHDTILLNLTVLTSLMMAPDEDLTKTAPVKKRKTKQDVLKETLRGSIVTTNGELHEAYCKWIDAVVEKDGYMSKQAVVYAQSQIDTFTNRNLDMALQILEIATVNVYKDITWAIKRYKDMYNVSFVVSTPQTPPTTVKKRLSDEVF